MFRDDHKNCNLLEAIARGFWFAWIQTLKRVLSAVSFVAPHACTTAKTLYFNVFDFCLLQCPKHFGPHMGMRTRTLRRESTPAYAHLLMYIHNTYPMSLRLQKKLIIKKVLSRKKYKDVGLVDFLNVCTDHRVPSSVDRLCKIAVAWPIMIFIFNQWWSIEAWHALEVQSSWFLFSYARLKLLNTAH